MIVWSWSVSSSQGINLIKLPISFLESSISYKRLSVKLKYTPIGFEFQNLYSSHRTNGTPPCLIAFHIFFFFLSPSPSSLPPPSLPDSSGSSQCIRPEAFHIFEAPVSIHYAIGVSVFLLVFNFCRCSQEVSQKSLWGKTDGDGECDEERKTSGSGG